MTNMPSPLPLSGPIQNDNTFCKQASRACLVSPFILVALGLGFRLVSHFLPGSILGVAALVFGGVSCLLLLAGLIMGILALLLMKPGGRTNIVACSLGGLVLLASFAALALPNVLHARARTLAQREAMLNTVAAAKAQDRPAAAPPKTNSQTVSLKQFTQQPEEPPKPTPAEDALLTRGRQAYLTRVQTVQSAYQAALSSLNAARVLCTSNLVDHGTIQARRVVVENFLNRNADWKNFMSGAEDNFRAELVRLNLSQPIIKATIADFHKSSLMQSAVIEDICAQDDRMGRGMLSVLDLLETNWGHWAYNDVDGRLRFDNGDLVEQYSGYLQEINEAAKKQEASQMRLAGITSQASLQ